MTKYEEQLLARIKKQFASDDHHCEIEPPEDPKELEQLLDALDSLEYHGHLMIIASPRLTNTDEIEVEPFPPCCVPEARQVKK